jgi:putative ABC transport system substrate-binding protein
MARVGRRRFLIATSALLGAPIARGQQTDRRYRVGAMIGVGGEAMHTYLSVLKERLAMHGFVEGRNLRIDARAATEQFHEDRETVRELLAAKPDALYTCLSRVTQAAQAATKTVPIVFVWVPDPIESGIVKDYARPGGNVTGVTTRSAELLVKHLELVRELVPEVKRVAVHGVMRRQEPSLFSPLRKAAAELGITLLESPATRLMGAADLNKLISDGAEAILSLDLYALQPVTATEVIRLTAEKRIPVIYADAAGAENGGLISYGTSLIEDMRRGADMLARVLRGAKPAELPVDQAARFELVVNLKTARALGVKVPQSVLVRADRVID